MKFQLIEWLLALALCLLAVPAVAPASATQRSPELLNLAANELELKIPQGPMIGESRDQNCLLVFEGLHSENGELESVQAQIAIFDTQSKQATEEVLARIFVSQPSFQMQQTASATRDGDALSLWAIQGDAVVAIQIDAEPESKSILVRVRNSGKMLQCRVNRRLKEDFLKD